MLALWPGPFQEAPLAVSNKTRLLASSAETGSEPPPLARPRHASQAHSCCSGLGSRRGRRQGPTSREASEENCHCRAASGED
eukprot:2913186-Pyramimonas_sp.AAC.1